MSYTRKIDQRTITIYDVRPELKDKTIEFFIKQNVSNARWEISRGTSYPKNGVECQRIHVKFDRIEHVDEFMSNRTFELNGKSVKVTRKLPNTFALHDRCVTGLKLKISSNKTMKTLNEGDLRTYFAQFGVIRSCQWENSERSEATFIYENYDSVDKAILQDPKPTIRGVEIVLEKKQSAKDFVENVRPFVVHVTNLPPSVTSETLSKILNVPIADILLNSSFHADETSEAWIYGFSDLQNASNFAQNAVGRQIGAFRIECEAKEEQIDEAELCKDFLVGRCSFRNECFHKHSTCDKPETCDDKNCWFGHSIERQTKSNEQPKRHETTYRLRISNLPPNVDRQKLAERLRLNSSEADFFVFQPKNWSKKSTQVVYLVRQRLHNRLRQQLGQLHNQSFSKKNPQPMKCQIELNQDEYDWDEHCQTTTMDFKRFFPSKRKSSTTNVSTPQLEPPIKQNENLSKNVKTSNRLRSESVRVERSPPKNLKKFFTRWKWTNLMMKNDYFWLDDREGRENDVVVKIYSTSEGAERPHGEHLALEKLKNSSFVLQQIETNSSWTIFKSMSEEKLLTFAKENPLTLVEILSLTRQILVSVREMHSVGVIHRDIRPENILIRKTSKELRIFFINFDLASIDGVSSTNFSSTIEHFDENEFYRMPQFEIESTSKVFDDPKIDATGVCSILFWLITGKFPRESKGINGRAPHRLPHHEKLITKKIQRETAFRQESPTENLVKRQLTEIFDRCFDGPERQMSVDELGFELKKVSQLILKIN